MRETARLTWGNPAAAEAATNAERIISRENENSIPDTSGAFSVYPTITMTTESGYITGTPSAVSVLFDARRGNYATEGELRYRIEEDEVERDEIQPFVNSSAYAYIPVVKSWEDGATLLSISVVCKKAKLSGRLLPLGGLLCGRCYEIPHNYLRNLNVAQSVDFSGATAPYSVLSSMIDADGLDGILGHRQKIVLETNRRVVGEYYVDSIKKTGRATYALTAFDALGCLASLNYSGEEFIGMTPASAAAVDIADEYTAIYNGAAFSPVGIIPEGDRRAALLQLATAAGCYVNGNKRVGDISAISLERVDYTSAASVVEKASTYTGPATENEDIVTKYALTTHSFTPDQNGEIIIQNQRYKDTKTVNEYTLGTSEGKDTKKTLSAALLVTDATAAANARRLMRERYSRRKIWRGSYLWQDGDEGRVGSVVQVRTADGSIIYGNVIKADLNFSAASIRVDADVLSFETLPAMEIWLGEEADVLTWSSDVPDASRFEIYRDGVLIGETDGNEWPAETPGDYIVIARGDRGAYSEASNVVHIAELKAIAAAIPQYDAGSIKHAAVDIVRGDAPLIIPQAVRDLPDYGAGVGDVYNEIDMEPVVYHNMKAVDLGTLTWTYSATNCQFLTNSLTDIVPHGALVCTKYYDKKINGWTEMTDGCISTPPTANDVLRIQDSRYTDAATFKASLSGVILHYEATSGGNDYRAKLYHRRIGSVDLGTMTWTYNATLLSHQTAKPANCAALTTGVTPVFLSNNYNTTKYNFNNFKNRLGSITGTTNGNILVNTDATQATLPTGILYYELASEQVFDITPYFPAAPVVNVSPGGSVTFENEARLEVPEKLAFRIPE